MKIVNGSNYQQAQHYFIFYEKTNLFPHDTFFISYLQSALLEAFCKPQRYWALAS